MNNNLNKTNNFNYIYQNIITQRLHIFNERNNLKENQSMILFIKLYFIIFIKFRYCESLINDINEISKLNDCENKEKTKSMIIDVDKTYFKNKFIAIILLYY